MKMSYEEIERTTKEVWQNNVKNAVKIAGSQKELGDRLGVSNITINGWLRGELPSSKNQLALYKYLCEHDEGLVYWAPKNETITGVHEALHDLFKRILDSEASLMKALFISSVVTQGIVIAAALLLHFKG